MLANAEEANEAANNGAAAPPVAAAVKPANAVPSVTPPAKVLSPSFF